MSFLSSVKKHLTSKKTKIAGASLLFLATALIGTLFIVRASAAPVSTPDCDANSVLWCGAANPAALSDKYDHGDGHNSEASIHNIYNCVGISDTDIWDMGTTSVSGYVTSSGDVYANGMLVATNAITGGRENSSGGGSTAHNCNGTTFWERKPAVTFLNPELSAMVVMKNGVFQFAILNSCGNPVIATPQKPNYSILKQVRAAGTSTYGSNVTVMAGTTVQYQITVSSTGQVPVDDVTARDALPSGIVYTAGTLEENGAALSSSQASAFFGSGITLASIKNGSKVVFTFNAVAGPNETYANCTPGTLNNEGYITSPVLPGGSSGATVNKQCQSPPKVTLTCNQLTLTPGTIDDQGNQTYTLVATASAQNATITGYDFNFGNGQSKTVATGATTASTTNVYAPGTYAPSVTVTATANGQTYKESSTNCTGSLTVKPLPQPVIACDELTLTAGTADVDTGDTPYTLVATGSATNATITGYVFNFGDNSQNQTITTGDTTATTTHTYAPGTYTPSVSVVATANGKTYTVSGAKCTGSITVGAPTPSTYACDDLTATATDSADASGNVTYALAAAAEATNATITGYTFTFGDSSQAQSVTTGDTTANVTHTYAPGSYTAQVTVTVKLPDGTTKQVTSAKCSTPITVATPTPTCTSPTNGQTYPVGSTECNAAPTCTSPTTGQTYPAGSSECNQPPASTTATVLVNTGPGQTIALFFGTVVVGFFGHKIILSRRNRRARAESK